MTNDDIRKHLEDAGLSIEFWGPGIYRADSIFAELEGDVSAWQKVLGPTRAEVEKAVHSFLEDQFTRADYADGWTKAILAHLYP